MVIAVNTPIEAVILAEAHVRAIGYPQMSPLDFVAAVRNERHQVLSSRTKLTRKEIVPGLKLRSGPSEIEVIKVEPTKRIVLFRTKKKRQLEKMTIEKFIRLANQQGYKKVWAVGAFLETLKKLLKPVLAAVPLMWIMKWILKKIRGRPIKFKARL